MTTACLETASVKQSSRAVATLTTLTLIERNNRTSTKTYQVADGKSARELYAAIGAGCDAQISSPLYDELILAVTSEDVAKYRSLA